MIGLVGCPGSAAVVSWIPRLLLRLVVRIQTPRSVAWFGGQDAEPIRLREVTDSSPPSKAQLPHKRYLSLPPTRHDLTQGQ